jgi:hypothetical protein
MFLMAVVGVVIVLGLGGMHNHEVGSQSSRCRCGCGADANHQAISSQYRALSSSYPWRPYLSHIPSIIQSTFKAPSNITLRLENGELAHIPPQLKKTTPNFHLLMPAEKDTDAFCKTTLSAMILNYPPPTVVNFKRRSKDDLEKAKTTLHDIWHYLDNGKYVQDEDLVLIVDGEKSWFQLPSDVIIKQYTAVLEDANIRLRKKYGTNKDGYQKYNQTIFFGAEKVCQDEDEACKAAPGSIMPAKLYRKEEAFDIADQPARYLNSKMLMGPARDLKVLIQVALGKLDAKHKHKQTLQSVFATMFAEQQSSRGEADKKPISSSAKFKALFERTKEKPQPRNETSAAKNHRRHEFSIGLDYAHALFQPFAYCAEDELAPLLHSDATALATHRHRTLWTKHLSLPPSLESTTPPFWRPNLSKYNPSPESNKPAYIEDLSFDAKLDYLPNRNTPWSNVPLVQNTYTGAVPAILFADTDTNGPKANITYNDLWYYPFKRALHRKHLRAPQSALGYHESLVGGDRAWDTRGGRGGVWTGDEEVWLEWGEGDGVCGKRKQREKVFEGDVEGEEGDKSKDEKEEKSKEG